VNLKSFKVGPNGYRRITVTFVSKEPVNINALDVWITIVTDAPGKLLRRINIIGDPMG